MPQQSMIPTRLSEGGGSDPVDSAPRKKAGCLRAAKNRQFLACVSATLTMLIVGTINGWTTTALFYQTSATREVPLTLGYDEYSWVVFLTVLCSMVGSFVGAQLADHSGRKYCLLLCCGMFTAGWILIYVENSIRILYLARVIHGIGIGIARTVNPVYVSEVADISIRGIPGILIAVNVYIGSLLTCYIGYWVTYESLLVILIIISLISLLVNICFPETPYFLVAKGQRKKARRSMAYYKDIIDPGKVKIELRELRAQTRSKLHPESRYELHQQSRSDIPSQSRTDLHSPSRTDLHSPSRTDLHSPSRTDLHSQSRTDLHSQSRTDLHSPSSSDLPSQSRSNLPPQSMHEGLLDPIQIADTEPLSNLCLPSSSDSPPLSVTHSQVLYGVHQQRTRELRLQPSRALCSQSTTELFRPSTTELFRPSTTELPRPSTTELFRPLTTELFRPFTTEIFRPYTTELFRPSTRVLLRPSTSELLRPSTRELLRPSTSELLRPSTRELLRPFTSELLRPSTSELLRPYTREIHRPFTSQIHQPSTSELLRPSTSEIYRPSTTELFRPSTSEIHRPVTSEVHRPVTSEVHRPVTSEVHRPVTSEVHQPVTSEIHRPITSQIHQPSTSEINRPSTSQIHRPPTSEINQPSPSQIHRPSTSELLRPYTREIYRPLTSQIHQPSTSELLRPSTSETHRPSTSETHRPSTSDSRSRSDSRTQSNVDSGASADINEIHMDGPKHTCLTKLQAILHRSNRKALFIMLGLIMAQQFSGNVTTTQYLEMVFSKTMIAGNSYQATILAQLVIVVSASLTIIIVNYVGRRILLLSSTVGSCITLCLLAYYLWLDQYMSYINKLDSIYITILIINQVMFQIGLGTIPKLLICELFPTEIKCYVGAIIVIFDGIISFTASKLYQVITDNGPSYAIYLIFATSCCLAFLLVYIWIPETKGKTYNEIKTSLVGTNTNSSNKCFRFHRRHVYRL